MKLDLNDLAGIEIAYHALLFRRHREIKGKGSFWEGRKGKLGDGYMALQALENILEDAKLLEPNERLTERNLQASPARLSRRIKHLRGWTREHYRATE